jgi:hypothetical protein
MAIDLDELERLAAQATHLPWKVWERDDRYIVDASGKRELARVSMRYKPYPERAEYIAAACNAVPELIAENRALRERVRELERQRELLAERLAFICRSHNDCVFECPNALLKIDCPDVTFEQWIEAAKEAGE